MRRQALQQRRTRQSQTPRARSLVIRATVLRPEPLRGSTQQLPQPGAWRTSNTRMQDLEASAASVLPAPAPVPAQQQQQPVLLSKLVKAHAARVSALVVLKDRPECKLIVSSSLDKYLAEWKIELAPTASNGHSTVSSHGLVSGHHQVACTRLAAPGGPVFSLVRQPQPATGSVFVPTAEVIYCGNASKEVVAWEVKATTPTDSIDGYTLGEANFQTVATDYTGWVRALALMGKWLFSCGCNFLVQHDTSFPIPKEVSKQELFKGDIQAIVAGVDHVYIASADGMIRAWTVAKKTGALSPAGEVPAAHSDRITGLAIHGSTLYSTGFDGSIKAWNADSLAMVAAVPAAHGGEKVHAIVVGSDGLLYTGGDDKFIRSWRPLSPALDFLAALEPVAEPQHHHHQELHAQPSLEDATSPLAGAPEVVPMLLPLLPPAGPPLSGHASSVRVLAAGSSECLVSGDSDGDLCVWALPRYVASETAAVSGTHSVQRARA